jgi:hypothetical protein
MIEEPSVDVSNAEELQKLIGRLESDLNKAKVLLQQQSGEAA